MSERNADEERCQDILQDLSLYIDREASASLCDEIERHLSECADCEVIVDTLQRTISLYHRLPQPEMPERLRTRLYQTFHLEEFLPETRPEPLEEKETD
ncbi:MAG: anti-sigma factor family protein [Aggregatilineales bacterium]